MDSYVTPSGWTNGPLSPTDKELQWLFAWLRANNDDLVNDRFSDQHHILEFGAGATSLVIQQALRPKHPGVHMMIEDYRPVIDALKPYLPPVPDAVIWTKIWHVSQATWDLCLVDSSVGIAGTGYKRHEAVKAAIPHMAKGGYIILHDWHAAGGRKPRKLLESLGWELVDCCYDRTGWGVYQCKK